jgi:hypothetical protein
MDVWTVQVFGQNYGPYALEQMKAFIAEGRIGAASLIACGQDAQFHLASEDPMLAQFLASPPGIDSERPAPNFGRAADEREPSHIVIMADMKSASISGLEDAIYSLGSAFPVMPQVWLLTTNESVSGVRNLLVQRLGKLDILFVIDATHDKAAWFNFGPEPEARLRRVWGRDATQRRTG